MKWIDTKRIGIGLLGLGLAATGCADQAVSTHQAAPLRAALVVDNCQGHDTHDSAALRQHARRTVRWKRAGGEVPRARQVSLQLLGFNDFHGQLAPRTLSDRPVGGAAVLASYLEAASRGLEANTLIVHAGDYVGASPPSSALLQDEPAISFLNTLANEHCKYERA